LFGKLFEKYFVFSKQQTLNILILQKHKLILLGMVDGAPLAEERSGREITSILLGWLCGTLIRLRWLRD
jgi:hypothetical protein